MLSPSQLSNYFEIRISQTLRFLSALSLVINYWIDNTLSEININRIVSKRFQIRFNFDLNRIFRICHFKSEISIVNLQHGNWIFQISNFKQRRCRICAIVRVFLFAGYSYSNIHLFKCCFRVSAFILIMEAEFFFSKLWMTYPTLKFWINFWTKKLYLILKVVN